MTLSGLDAIDACVGLKQRGKIAAAGAERFDTRLISCSKQRTRADVVCGVSRRSAVGQDRCAQQA